MHLVGSDLRYGARLLRGAPAFSVIALATLALGIGATTAIFSMVDAVLLKPLPFRDAGGLATIWENNPASGADTTFVAPENFREWQRQTRSFEGMAAIQGTHLNLTGGPAGPIEGEELAVERASANLFPLLGVAPVAGRTFREDEDRPGAPNLALLGYALWLRRFGGDPKIAGKAIRLGGQSYTVVGVMPRDFSVLDPAAEIWTPLALDPDDARAAGLRYLQVIARRRPGVTLERARADLDAIARRLEQANPALNKGWRPSLVPLRQELAGRAERALLILLAAVGLLLLMACANVANLLLARGAGRRKEIAIRVAMGAGRGRIAAQLLAESVLLALAGGALGVLLARGGVALLARFGPASIPRLARMALDPRALLFALGASCAAGILFGLAPALQASETKIQTILTEGGRSGMAGHAARTARHALVVAQVALAVVVLIAAGLLMRSFLRLRMTDPGFRPSGLLCFRLPLSGGRNAAPERRAAFIAQVEERIGALPGGARGGRGELHAPARLGRGYRLLGRWPAGAGSGPASAGPHADRHARLFPGHGHSARGGPRVSGHGRRRLTARDRG